MAETGLAAAVDQRLTRAQRARRQRILDAARGLAAKGGYDGLQMRDVADRADVALGTLYRYFPSKVHLLIALMREQTEQLAERLDRRPPAGDTAADRVVSAISRATAVLQREPGLAEAMTRALMFADTSAAADVDSVTRHTTDAITRAMQGDDREPTDEDPAIARVIEQVWLSSILAWLSGRSSTAQMNQDLEVAVRLLLR